MNRLLLSTLTFLLCVAVPAAHAGGNKKPKPTPTPSPASKDPDWQGSGTTGSPGAWLTGTNWVGNAVPGTTDTANFANSTTGVGILMSGSTNNGSKNQAVGAITLSPGGSSLTIGNTATGPGNDGTLTLNGATVNSVANTILSDTTSTATTLTLQNTVGSGNDHMAIALGSTTNIVNATAGNTIAISSVISQVNAGSGITFTGGGTLNLSGNNAFTGTLTVQDGTLSIATINNSGANGVLGNNATAVVLGGSGTTGTLEYTGGNGSSSKKFTMATGGTGVFQVDTAATNLTLSGVIDGGGPLTKTGAGTLTLSGANTYSGDTTISAGTLDIGAANAIPNGTGKGNVIVNGTLDFATGVSAATINGLSGSGFVNNSQTGMMSTNATLTVGNNDASATFSGVLENPTGPGTNKLLLTKIGTGTQVLSGANTYQGGTTISAGTLQFAKTNSMPSTGAVTVSSGATLAVNAGGTNEWTNGTSGGGTLGGLIAGTGGQGTTNQVSWTAGSVLGIDTTNAAGGTLTYGGVIGSFRTGGNSVGLTKLGTGTLTLTGANTYTGTTTISAGTLQLGNGLGTGTLSTSSAITDNGTFTIDRNNAVSQGVDFSVSAITGTGAFVQAGSGTTILNAANGYSGGTTVSAGILKMSGAGTLGSTSGTLTMNGGLLDLNGTNQSVGALNGSGGSIENSAPSGGGGAKTLTIGTGDTSGSFSGKISDHDSGGSGFVKLIKTGTGTETMTSTTSNYTGGTDINGGVLISNSSNGGALGRGPISVNSGGTLAGAQTIDSAASITVNAGGTLMPGTTASSGSYAKLNTGAVTLAASSTFAVDINGGSGPTATGAGTLYDQINVTGNLSIAGALSLTFGNTTLALGDKFFIALYSGSESGTFSNTTNLGTTYTQAGETFLVDYTDLFGTMTGVSLTVIPEPRTYFAATLTLLALGYTLRKRVISALKRA